MALTREYKTTVTQRIKNDPEFARAIYAEALNALLTGETEDGLSMLRDLVHAEISFKELSRVTGVGEKSLHRMLSRRGNPRTETLGKVVAGIRDTLGYVPQISVAVQTGV
jgi:DNA-binding phage protein